MRVLQESVRVLHEIFSILKALHVGCKEAMEELQPNNLASVRRMKNSQLSLKAVLQDSERWALHKTASKTELELMLSSPR